MIFVSFGKLRKKPTKEMTASVTKIMEEFKEHGNKILGSTGLLGVMTLLSYLKLPVRK